VIARRGIPGLVVAALTSAILVMPAGRASATIADQPVRTGPLDQWDAVGGAGVIAWQQNSQAHPKHYDYFAKSAGHNPIRVNARGTSGDWGQIDGNRLVFEQYQGSSADIKFFDLNTHERTNPPPGVNTSLWEYWPREDGKWLLFGRLDTSNDRRKLILYNISTHHSQVLDSTTNHLEPGQVAGRFAVWYVVTPDVHYQVKEMNLQTGKIRVIAHDFAKCDAAHRTRGGICPTFYNYGPSVTSNGTAFYLQAPLAKCSEPAKLIKRPLGASPHVIGSTDNTHQALASSAWQAGDGSTHILHDRSRCGGGDDEGPSDIYEFVEK
jgi:hypothetical protein